jgi:hypothetical protein
MTETTGCIYFARRIGEADWRGMSSRSFALAEADPTMETTTIWAMQESAEANVTRLLSIINTPETESFLEGVKLEAAHQQERWGSTHDEGKTPTDWVFLVGHLLTKAAMSFLTGNLEKAKHHTISSAAACYNWHQQIAGKTDGVRPGIREVDTTARLTEAEDLLQDVLTNCSRENRHAIKDFFEKYKIEIRPEEDPPCREEGANSFRCGQSLQANPYKEDGEYHAEWVAGWKEAQVEYLAPKE